MELLARPARQMALFWRSSWPLTLAMILLVLAGPFAEVASTLLGGRIVDGLLAGRGFADLVGLAVGLAVALVVIRALAAVRAVAVSALAERTTAEVDALVADTALAPHGIGHLEDADVVTPLRRINDDLHSMYASTAVPGTWQVYAIRLTGVGFLVLVARWNPLVAVGLVAANILTAQVFNGYVSSLTSTIFGVAAQDKARERWYRNLTTRRDAAKEVRLFGMADWALDRSHALWQGYAAGEWRRRGARLKPTLAAMALALAVHVGALWFLGADLWAGRLGVGEGLVVLTAMAGLAAFGNLGDSQTWAVRHQTQLAELDALRRRLGLGGVLARRPAFPTATRSAGAPCAVDLDDVAFTYPSRSEPIFAHLDLHIPAGQSCAVVGVNGAGKSTLIKLLTGLYPPDAGTVRVDGVDPALDDHTRRRVAVIFQEFSRYPADVVDNVALATPGTHAERAALTERALERAAATAVLERVGSVDALLGAEFEGGTDLSGGQWQRIALARALAAVEAGAGVLVLDEPTSALDVRAEAALFERFLAMTQGVTTLLVSHRLSSVRHADRIVVLDEGVVVEDGTHEELLALGGRYAAAFTLQASRFDAAGSPGSPSRERSDEATGLRLAELAQPLGERSAAQPAEEGEDHA